MKNKIQILGIALLALSLSSNVIGADACCPKITEVAVVASATTPVLEAPLSEVYDPGLAFLIKYEGVRAALAADDFAAAKKAAAALPEAAPIAKAANIAEARTAFKALSVQAVAHAKGRTGYHVAHCPMVKGGGGDWVQTTKTISNPYYGSSMLTCGTIKN